MKSKILLGMLFLAGCSSPNNSAPPNSGNPSYLGVWYQCTTDEPDTLNFTDGTHCTITGKLGMYGRDTSISTNVTIYAPPDHYGGVPFADTALDISSWGTVSGMPNGFVVYLNQSDDSLLLITKEVGAYAPFTR